MPHPLMEFFPDDPEAKMTKKQFAAEAPDLKPPDLDVLELVELPHETEEGCGPGVLY